VIFDRQRGAYVLTIPGWPFHQTVYCPL
jgi:hypothetical protein